MCISLVAALHLCTSLECRRWSRRDVELLSRIHNCCLNRNNFHQFKSSSQEKTLDNPSLSACQERPPGAARSLSKVCVTTCFYQRNRDYRSGVFRETVVVTIGCNVLWAYITSLKIWAVFPFRRHSVWKCWHVTCSETSVFNLLYLTWWFFVHA